MYYIYRYIYLFAFPFPWCRMSCALQQSSFETWGNPRVSSSTHTSTFQMTLKPRNTSTYQVHWLTPSWTCTTETMRVREAEHRHLFSEAKVLASCQSMGNLSKPLWRRCSVTSREGSSEQLLWEGTLAIHVYMPLCWINRLRCLSKHRCLSTPVFREINDARAASLSTKSITLTCWKRTLKICTAYTAAKSSKVEIILQVSACHVRMRSSGTESEKKKRFEDTFPSTKYATIPRLPCMS